MKQGILGIPPPKKPPRCHSSLVSCIYIRVWAQEASSRASDCFRDEVSPQNDKAPFPQDSTPMWLLPVFQVLSPDPLQWWTKLLIVSVQGIESLQNLSFSNSMLPTRASNNCTLGSFDSQLVQVERISSHGGVSPKWNTYITHWLPKTQRPSQKKCLEGMEESDQRLEKTTSKVSSGHCRTAADTNQQLPWFSAGDQANQIPGQLWEGFMSSPLARELWPVEGF